LCTVLYDNLERNDRFDIGLKFFGSLALSRLFSNGLEPCVHLLHCGLEVGQEDVRCQV